MIASMTFGKVINVTYLGDPGTSPDPVYAVAGTEVVSSATKFGSVMCLPIPFMIIFVFPQIAQFKLRRGRVPLRPFQNENMPYSGCDALVVSAVCHPDPDEDDISTQLINWGVVDEAEGLGRDRPGRCSLSSREVEAPREGRRYFGIAGPRESPPEG